MRTTHKKLVFWMCAVSITAYSMVFFGFLWPRYHNAFSWLHYWSFYCFIFLLGWWITYFGSKILKIWSLRLFLDKRGRFRELTQQEKSDNDQQNELKTLEQYIINKSTSTITIQGIFIAVVALFLTFVLQSECHCEYQKFLRFFALITALTTIILMVFAIDLLDTVANLFREGNKTPFEYQVYFYRDVGALLPKGGVSYAYYGYASFSLFFILSLSFFSPLLAGLGLSFFTYLGYPVLFGYTGEWNDKGVEEIEFDEKTKWPSITLGAFFLIATSLIWYFG